MEEVSTPRNITGKTTLGSNSFSLIQEGQTVSAPSIRTAKYCTSSITVKQTPFFQHFKNTISIVLVQTQGKTLASRFVLLCCPKRGLFSASHPWNTTIAEFFLFSVDLLSLFVGLFCFVLALGLQDSQYKQMHHSLMQNSNALVNKACHGTWWRTAARELHFKCT